MDNELIEKEEEKEILLAMAAILKKNCDNHPDCVNCPLLGRYTNYIGFICPISIGDNPCEWALDPVN